ncbi:MAG: hypothetical protein ACJ74W_20425 [Pyrinomonadaceae bacterium]
MSSDRLTEILNYVSAISRDIGIFRAEVNTRLDQLEARVESLETRMQSLETKVQDLAGEIQGLRTDVRTLSARLDRLGARVLEGLADQHELEDRIAALEEKLSAS